MWVNNKYYVYVIKKYIFNKNIIFYGISKTIIRKIYLYKNWIITFADTKVNGIINNQFFMD
jgi:hypothetical protein